MDRRTFLAQLPFLISPLAGIANYGEPALKGSSVRIAVLNDLHHDSEECDPWFQKIVQLIQGENPDFCVLAGDIANRGLESSLKSIRDKFAQLHCPVYPIPGNHDCDVTGDTSLYEKIFPGRLNYLERVAGWQFLFLDTTQGKDWENTLISGKTLSWLDKTIPDLDARAPTLVFSHFPLASEIHMAPLNVEEVWLHLRKLNVRAAFCGHYHGQHQIILPPMVTTNICCARKEVRGNFNQDPRKGFWIVDADSDTGRLNIKLKQIAPS